MSERYTPSDLSVNVAASANCLEHEPLAIRRREHGALVAIDRYTGPAKDPIPNGDDANLAAGSE